MDRYRIATIEAIASMFQRDHASHLVALTPAHIEEINARIIDTSGSMSDEQCEAMFHLFSKYTATTPTTRKAERPEALSK